MNKQGAVVLASSWLLGACGGGGGGGSPGLDPASLIPPQPTYPTVTTFAPYWTLQGVGTTVTVDRSANTLAETPVSTVSGQVAASASGISSLSITVTGVAGVVGGSFSQLFQATDLTTVTPIPGLAPRALLSGTKTATDLSVRTLTILDSATAGFNYMVLGSWEYASTSGATSAVGGGFVFGPMTRSTDIPATGSASYSGVMFGRYADGTTVWSATAQASALANFVAREVAFSTTDTRITNLAITQPRADLNLSGTFTYTGATNNLTTVPGGLATASGPGQLTGQGRALFFGPPTGSASAPAEIGGTFFVKDASNTHHQMTGTFGLGLIP